MQSFLESVMRAVGRMHIALCKIPVVGEPIARGYSWFMAGFPWLGGVRRTTCIEATKQHLIEAGEQMGFPFEFSETRENEFTLDLPFCPYGFDSPDHERACDTAMHMDHVLLRRCGAELIITETIPKGAARCRMLVRQDDTTPPGDPR